MDFGLGLWQMTVFRFSTQCPFPGNIGWSGWVRRRHTCISRTLDQKYIVALWRLWGSRSLQVVRDDMYLIKHDLILKTFSGYRIFRGYKELCNAADKLPDVNHIVFVVSISIKRRLGDSLVTGIIDFSVRFMEWAESWMRILSEEMRHCSETTSHISWQNASRNIKNNQVREWSSSRWSGGLTWGWTRVWWMPSLLSESWVSGINIITISKSVPRTPHFAGIF